VLPNGRDSLAYLRLPGSGTDILIRGDDVLAGLSRGDTVPLALRRGGIYSVETTRLIGSFGDVRHRPVA